MCCVHNGLISEDDIDTYKKENVKHILESLENQRKKEGNTVVADITEADVNFEEEETFDE